MRDNALTFADARTARTRAMDALAGLSAGAALACLPRGVGPVTIALCAVLGACAVTWLLREGREQEPPSTPADTAGAPRALPLVTDPLGMFERLAPWTALLFFIPVFTLPVAPGIDMAMHAALARALEEGARELSPAWPGVAPEIYPRGFSALMALVSFAGNARGSLIAAGIAFAIYQSGIESLFAANRMRRPALLAALATLLSRTPQAWFGWGGLPNVLALGVGLRAAALVLDQTNGPSIAKTKRAMAAALLLGGGAAVHPTGALAAALVLIAMAATAVARTRAWNRLLPPLAPLGALAAIFALVALFGPAMSPRELDWMAGYARSTEAIVHGPPALFAWNIWRALGPTLGDPWTIACALSFTWLAVHAWRERSLPALGILARPILAVLALGAMMALAPLVPRVGLYLYPSRFAPLLALSTAPLLAAALDQLAQARISSSAPAGLSRFGPAQLTVAALFASALLIHVRVFQRAAPLASRDDLRAIHCLAEKLPADAVIEGAYDDATEWIPALTGHRVTQPQKHCSLFDEGDAGLDQLHAAYRYRGDRASSANRFTAPEDGAEPLCSSGAARLWALPIAH